MKYTLAGILVFFLVGVSLLRAQDPAFSQYYAASLFLNPALAGEEQNTKITLNQRSNINQQLYPYYLQQFSVITPVNLKRLKYVKNKNPHVGGIGFTAYQELSGPEKSLNHIGTNISMAYYTRISGRQYLSFGLQVGIVQKKIDYSRFQWGSQFDPLVGHNQTILPSVSLLNERTNFPVFNAGLLWIFQPQSIGNQHSVFDAFAGISTSNLNMPDQGFDDNSLSELPILYKTHGGISWNLNRNVSLLPNFLFLYQNQETQFNFGTYLSYKTMDLRNRIQIGTWYRLHDSFILALAFKTLNFQIAISYDFNVSTFRTYNHGAGASEISLSYSFNKGKYNKSVSHPIM